MQSKCIDNIQFADLLCVKKPFIQIQHKIKTVK